MSKTEYKGFLIERENVGKFGTSTRFKSGKFIAPTKKLVKEHIDNITKRKELLDIEFKQLKKHPYAAEYLEIPNENNQRELEAFKLGSKCGYFAGVNGWLKFPELSDVENILEIIDKNE